MDASPATRKVAFCLISIILMLVGMFVLSNSAEATTGFFARSVPGVPTINVRTKPSNSAMVAYSLPSGAPIDIRCILRISALENWLELTDGNYLALAQSSYHSSFTIAPNCKLNGNFPDRTLLQASGPAVYVIQSGKLLWVPNEETLNTCLGGRAKVSRITDAELNSTKLVYPNGGTASCPISFPNGSLLQASGPGVYLVLGGVRLGIPNPSVLACYGGWAGVKKVSDFDLSRLFTSYPDGGVANCPYSLPNGAKLLAPNGTVFFISNGRAYGMPSEWALVTCYGGWAGVRSASQAEINTMLSVYPFAGAAGCAGPSYSLPNGAKLLAPNGTVFFISNGRAYGMPSEWALVTCYGGWAGVRSASQAEINTMLSVYPFAGAAGCAGPTIGAREQKAVDWMRAQLGLTGWNSYCELMIEQAYGTRGRYASALAHANSKIARGEMNSGDRNVPAGAIAFFGAATVNGGYGHVMISIGGGQFISNGYSWNGITYGARVTTIDSVGAGPYIGWAWADAGWSR